MTNYQDLITAGLVYLFIINLATFLIFGRDKKLAIGGSSRISEKTLLSLSLIGGSLGGLLGMNYYRHKTKKPKFYLTLPLMLFLHLGIILYIVLK